jgi:hypothetical protein
MNTTVLTTAHSGGYSRGGTDQRHSQMVTGFFSQHADDVEIM